MDRQSVIKSVRLWGGIASDAVLDPACKIFSSPEVEGLMGYRVEQESAFVFGDPICSSKNLASLVSAFHRFCKEKQLQVIYLTVSKTFTQWALQQGYVVASIEFGKELTLDPHLEPTARTGVKASLVRRKVRHALHEGVVVKEYQGTNTELEGKIEQLASSWLKSRHGLQVHISHIRLFEDRLGKRWFYAEKEDTLLGVVILNQLQERKGWLLNRYLVLPDAPGGVPEFMIMSALETLRQENCHVLSLGVVPEKQLGQMTGMNQFQKTLIRFIYKMAHWVLHLDGRFKFWDKFSPEKESSYLLFSNPRIGIRDLLGFKRALNINF